MFFGAKTHAPIPTAGASSGDVLTFQADGTFVFQAPVGGGGGLDNIVEDLTPQLGGELDAQSNKIVSLADPTADQDAATKFYVDDSVGFVFDYFFGDTSDAIGGIYYVMTDNDLAGGESDLTTVIGSSGNDKPLVNWITPLGEPGIVQLTAGIYKLHVHAEKTAGGSTVDALYWELYKYETDTTETLLGTSEISQPVTAKTEYDIHLPITSPITLGTTDRLLVKMFANLGSGGGATVVLSQEGVTASHFEFQTESSILSNIFVRQDGASTMSGKLNIDITSVGTAQTIGSSVINSTDAATGAQQFSPVFELEGQGWKTDATAETQEVKWGFQTRPVQGTSSPTSVLDIMSSINGGAFSAKASLTSAGVLTTTTFVGDLTGDVTGDVSGSSGSTTGNAATVTTNADLTGIVTSSGNATAIADKAIAIAKLADGTDGELITWSAAGVIAVVGVGTVNQVLTSGGVGVAPTFEDATGGASQLDELSDVVSATNTNRFILIANGTTGYVGRILEAADVPTLNQNTTGQAGTVATIDGLAPDTATTQATQGSITSIANLATVGTIASGIWSSAITGANLTDALILGENASIALDPAGSADGKYSGTTVTGLSGYSQSFGDVVTLDKDDSRWEAVDISVAAAATGDARGIVGMVVVAGTDGNACTILLAGIKGADANFPALTIGANVYASTTGDIVVAQPTTTDHVIRIMGGALTANEIRFRPDYSWTTHT